MTPQISKTYAEMPPEAQPQAMAIRDLIFAAAKASNSGPLTETLKWGQPSYLTEATKSGTTVRIAYSPKHPDKIGLYVPCQTDLVDQYRERFADEFTYEGNRAVLMSLSDPLPDAALHQVISMALTYHRDKR